MSAPAPATPRHSGRKKAAVGADGGPAAAESPPGAEPAAPDARGEEPGQQTTTRDAALALLLRQGEATAAELALQLMVSVQVMRRHLRSLQEEGLVQASPAAEGPGRPSNRWHLTDQGRERFPRGGEDFALGLLQSLAASLSPAQLDELMERQAERKAADYRGSIGEGPLAERLKRLLELRRSEGFVAELRPDPENPRAWVLSEFHCSVMRIATEFPMVCDQELQLLQRTFSDCRVERVHWRLEEGHSCGFRLLPAAGVH